MLITSFLLFYTLHFESMACRHFNVVKAFYISHAVTHICTEKLKSGKV